VRVRGIVGVCMSTMHICMSGCRVVLIGCRALLIGCRALLIKCNIVYICVCRLYTFAITASPPKSLPPPSNPNISTHAHMHVKTLTNWKESVERAKEAYATAAMLTIANMAAHLESFFVGVNSSSIYIYIYIHIYIYIYIYICIHIYIYIYIHEICIHIYIYIYTHTHIFYITCIIDSVIIHVFDDIHCPARKHVSGHFSARTPNVSHELGKIQRKGLGGCQQVMWRVCRRMHCDVIHCALCHELERSSENDTGVVSK